jgi:DNA-binding XRE family transcriptional regulator
VAHCYLLVVKFITTILVILNLSVKGEECRGYDMSDLKAVGRRLRQLRGFDISQEEFARRLEISQSQLSKYERGVAAPPAEVLIRIKERLRVSIDWLLSGDN